MKLFKKILIANRGEIAIRVHRACKELGVPSVAVFSEADRNSLHVLLADEAYCIGPAASRESYLNLHKIIEVAKKSGADAIHPGYGFLSENEDFAEACQKAGITFIGPSVHAIASMGDKLAARDLMKKAGVPCVPGSDGPVSSPDEIRALIKKVGFPVIIKASAGGGGKGMRLVKSEADLESAIRAARSEALSYFGDDKVYVEKYVTNPKHIEIQVFGDGHGNVTHLFERECSIQRRHQKIIEEAPSPALSNETRMAMGEIAVKAAKSVSYQGAGTVEFIYDIDTKDFYFLEMNTRLQVEHPVTELVTGVDLVQEQILVAAGERLSFSQNQLKQNGWAIEARIYAEDPITFMPSPGKIVRCRHPQGPFTRIDSYVYPGYEVPMHYDPMIAKLSTWGSDRREAIDRCQRALDEFILTGIKTNIPLHKRILQHDKFLKGDFSTHFIEKDFDGFDKLFTSIDDRVFLITAAIEAYNEQKSQGVWDLNLVSNWKRLGRRLSLR
ncbi:MAG: acetyl-CoA carboxylase biotin carboxylase subunit [Oligoflexia bacterium]|nr:acetyl-CoA carboxylase biotin carboxylase subunit [Oligoflexia bacterium]